MHQSRAVRVKRAKAEPGELERPNTIGVKGRDLVRLLNSLDVGEIGRTDRRRVHTRWPYRVVSVPVRLDMASGGAELRMACRNLSCGGVGLLHNSYVHTETPCTVQLPVPDQGTMAVRGLVVRCQHVQGTVHEVGVKFDTEVDVRDFVRPDLAAGWFSVENVTAEDLEGVLLHVEPDPQGRKAVRHGLSESKVRIRGADGAEQAIELAAEGVSLIVCDWSIVGSTALDLANELRSAGIVAPIVLTATMTNDQVRAALSSGHFAAFLKKPVEKDKLVRAIAEFKVEPQAVSLNADGDGEGGEGRGPAINPELRAVFAKQAAQHAETLRAAVGGGTAIEIYATCAQVKGLAPVAGSGELGELSDDICEALSTAMELEPVKARVERLIQLCDELASPPPAEPEPEPEAEAA